MVVTKADSRKRVRVPQAKPGQEFAVHENADGSLTLKALDKAASTHPTCRLADEGGFPIAVPDQPIDEEAIKELLVEFP